LLTQWPAVLTIRFVVLLAMVPEQTKLPPLA